MNKNTNVMSSALIRKLKDNNILIPELMNNSNYNFLAISTSGEQISYIPTINLKDIEGFPSPFCEEARKFALRGDAYSILSKASKTFYPIKEKDKIHDAFFGLFTLEEIAELKSSQKDDILKTYLYQLDQQELLSEIESILIEKSIEYNKDKMGNIWSFNHKGAPAFVAHLDTVISYNKNYKRPVKIKDGILFRDEEVLGADDRAGVNAIINHIDNINFIFCLDEESGRLGSIALSKVDKFKEDCLENITFFIQLDRKGNEDVIGYTHGYCDKELEDKILKVLTTHSSARGSYTDIDSFTSIAQGVNISCGYYKAHTDSETLNIKEFIALDSKIIELSNIKEELRTYKKPVSTIFGNYYNAYGYYSTGCECCQDKGTWRRDIGRYLCDDCYREVKVEEALATLGIFQNTGKCDFCGETIKEGEIFITINEFTDIEMNCCSACASFYRKVSTKKKKKKK